MEHVKSILDNVIYLDIETTGLDEVCSEIIEIGAIKFKNGAVTKYETLIRPRGRVPVEIYNLCTGIFSAFGDSKTPFIFLAISSIANVFMDIVFVVVFQMGIAGVAWATFICQGISSILSFVIVLYRIKKLKPFENEIDPVKPFDFRLLKTMLIIAIPSILQQSFVSIGNILIQSVINSFGESTMAGYSAVIKLQNLIVTGLTTLSNGISNYTAQNLGRGKIERIRPGFISGLKLTLILIIPFSIIYFFFG